MRLILASTSATRQAMLSTAGGPVETEASSVDEAAIKATEHTLGKSAGEVALEPACAKAIAVSDRHTGALVIGADQMLDCAGE